MNIDYLEKDKLLKIDINEEIDHHKADFLRRNIDYEIQRRIPKEVILNFSGVSFMDSAGIGMVIGRYRVASMLGAKLEMTNVSDSVKKVFEMTGVLKIVPIIDEKREVSIND